MYIVCILSSVLMSRRVIVGLDWSVQQGFPPSPPMPASRTPSGACSLTIYGMRSSVFSTPCWLESDRTLLKVTTTHMYITVYITCCLDFDHHPHHTILSSLVPRPLLCFQCCTQKTWEWPGDKATHFISAQFIPSPCRFCILGVYFTSAQYAC